MPKFIKDYANIDVESKPPNHQKIYQNASQIIEVVARSASEGLLEPGWFQDFPKWSSEAVFRNLLEGFKAILVAMLAQLGPEGDPKINNCCTESQFL